MKNLKKIMLASLMLGAVGTTSACSLGDSKIELSEENINEIVGSVNDYMNSNKAYSSQYAKDSLNNYLVNGIKKFASASVKDYEIEYYKNYCSSYMLACSYDPWNKVKFYIDDENSQYKLYIYDDVGGNTDDVELDSFYIVTDSSGAQTTYRHYDVSEKKYYENQSPSWQIKQSDPLNLYREIYDLVNKEGLIVNVNNVGENGAEYTIFNETVDDKGKVAVAVYVCKFENGLLVEYNRIYKEVNSPDYAIVEGNKIKYDTGDEIISDLDSYTAGNN